MRVYLDANAGSRMRPSIAEAVSACALVGNPSSVHHDGRAARALLREARRSILKFLGLSPTALSHRLLFTSGGTEACNLLVSGFLGSPFRLGLSHGHLLSSDIEHPAVREPLEQLAGLGWDLEKIAPDAEGRVSANDFLAALRKDTALVCLMTANNETGAIQPIVEVAKGLRAKGYRGVIVSDFVQAMGKLSLSVAELFQAGVDAVSISAHKVGAPAGCGALVFRQGDPSVCHTFSPLFSGGVQEEGFRPGTENLLGAVAFGLACERAAEEGDALRERLRALRDLLWLELSQLPNIEPVGPRDLSAVLPNTLMVRFVGMRADDLVVALDVHGVMASTGSACVSGKQSVSPVVRAMGFGETEAREVVRLSVDWCSTEEEIRFASKVIRSVVMNAIQQSPDAELVRSQTQSGVGS